MKITILETIGENCITFEDGDRVYQVVHPELLASRDVQLDFEGVEVLASPFFNAAIGRLLKDITAETLNRCLNVHNLSAAGMMVLKRVIENSKEYYSDTDRREILHKLLSESSEEE